jgi:hypothetical protein
MSGVIGGAGSKSGVIGTTELDYEEGEFTFAVTSSSGTFNIAAAYATGYYCKIGSLVHIQGTLATTTGSTGTGYAKLTLPFVNANFTHEAESAGGGVAGYNVNISAGTLTWEIPAGASTYVKFQASVDAGAWGTIDFSNPTGYYLFSIHYITSL